MPVEAPETHMGDFVQVNLIGRYHSQTTIMTHLWKYYGESNSPMKLTLADVAGFFLIRLWTDAQSWYRNNMVSTFSLQAVTAQVIHPIRSIAWPAVPLAADAPGIIVGPSLPSGVAAVLRRRGNFGDRKNYGRVYIPALPVTFVTDSQLSATALAGLQPLADKQQEDVTIPGEGGNALFHQHILNKANVAASREVTHGMVDKQVRYQRRREVGVGI